MLKCKLPMNPFLRYFKELNKFMAWFKEIYPRLYEKYNHNIDMPLMKGGQININNCFHITPESRQLLIGIAKDYYNSVEI